MRSDDGTASKQDVIKVLETNGVEVSPQDGGFDGMVVLEKGGTVEARRLPDRPGKKLLHYIARKYEIPIYKFYE